MNIWHGTEDAPRTPRRASPIRMVVAGIRRFQITLGPFPSSARRLAFRFHCEHPGCTLDGP